MKGFLYIILAVLFLSVLVVPVVEVFMLGRDRILLASALYNSFRAARESSYSYEKMREIEAVADEEAFLRSFADTFAASYGMDCIDPTANPLQFTCPDRTFNDFEVHIGFMEEMRDGGAIATVVTLTAKTEYKFRTAYMQALDSGGDSPYLLQKTQSHTMSVTN